MVRVGMKKIEIYLSSFTKKEQDKLIKALNRLPKEAIIFLYKRKIIFIKNSKKALAFIVGTPKDITLTKKDAIMVLSPEIWDFDDDDFLWVIAHEIIHHYLGHNKRSKKNEKEADDLTAEWMNRILKKG